MANRLRRRSGNVRVRTEIACPRRGVAGIAGVPLGPMPADVSGSRHAGVPRHQAARAPIQRIASTVRSCSADVPHQPQADRPFGSTSRIGTKVHQGHGPAAAARASTTWTPPGRRSRVRRPWSTIRPVTVPQRKAMNSRPLNAAAADWIDAAEGRREGTRSACARRQGERRQPYPPPDEHACVGTPGETPRNISSSDKATNKLSNRTDRNTPTGGSRISWRDRGRRRCRATAARSAAGAPDASCSADVVPVLRRDHGQQEEHPQQETASRRPRDTASESSPCPPNGTARRRSDEQ